MTKPIATPNDIAHPYEFKTRALLPTVYGDFHIHMFANSAGQEQILLTHGLENLRNNDSSDGDGNDITPLVRVHSECLTGDAFLSLKCDCGAQLNHAMAAIVARGVGAVVYLRQEGRGIGLVNKIRAYALQDQGHDTISANTALGLPIDARSYEMVATMLQFVGIHKLDLLTNNPNKVAELAASGLTICARVPLVVGITPQNIAYLKTKQQMGHYLGDSLQQYDLQKTTNSKQSSVNTAPNPDNNKR